MTCGTAPCASRPPVGRPDELNPPAPVRESDRPPWEFHGGLSLCGVVARSAATCARNAARRLLNTSNATAASSTRPLMSDWYSVPTPRIDMPLFSRPMMRPPMIAPGTEPMPPVTAAPPMNTAAMASSSKPLPAPGAREVELAGEDHAGEGRDDAHVHEEQERDALGLDRRQLRGEDVATDRVDVPTEDRAPHDHRVDDHEQPEHDEHDRWCRCSWRAAARRRRRARHRGELDDEPDERLALELVLAAGRTNRAGTRRP